MTIYYLLLFSIVISGFLSKCKTIFRKYKLQIWYLNLSLMILLAGLRAETVGTDTAVYKDIFYAIGRMSLKDVLFGMGDATAAKARGYALLVKIIYLIFGSYQVLLLVVSVVTCLSIAYFIRQNTTHIYLALTIFVMSYMYCSSLNVHRQYLAMSIALLSYCMMKQNKKALSLILFAFAFSIHMAVLGMLLALLLEWKEISVRTKRNMALITAFACVILSILWNNLLAVIMKLFPSYSYLVDVEIQQQGRSIYLYFFYLLFWIVGLYMVYTGKMSREKRKKMINLLIYSGIGIFASIAASRIYVLTRIIGVYNLFSIVMIPEVMRFLDKKNRILVMAATLAILMIPFTVLLLENNGECVPYRFFFN